MVVGRAATDALLNKTLVATVEYVDGPEHVSVVEAGSKDELGQTLVRQGWLLAAKRREGCGTSSMDVTIHSASYLKPLLAQFEAAQQAARGSHAGIWVYGDIISDEAKVRASTAVHIVRDACQEFGYATISSVVAPKK